MTPIVLFLFAFGMWCFWLHYDWNMTGDQHVHLICKRGLSLLQNDWKMTDTIWVHVGFFRGLHLLKNDFSMTADVEVHVGSWKGQSLPKNDCRMTTDVDVHVSLNQMKHLPHGMSLVFSLSLCLYSLKHYKFHPNLHPKWQWMVIIQWQSFMNMTCPLWLQGPKSPYSRHCPQWLPRSHSSKSFIPCFFCSEYKLFFILITNILQSMQSKFSKYLQHILIPG